MIHRARSFDGLMHGKQTDWETWGCGHSKSRQEEVESLQDLLPTSRKLSEEYVKIITGKLPTRLEKV